MPIDEDTVALEKCPAQTAETISYAATFTVLGWLLLSNYSGFGQADAERRDQAIVSANSSPAAIANTPVIYSPATYRETGTLNETPPSGIISNQLEAESGNFVTSPPTWHADLAPSPPYENHTHPRVFSTSSWNAQTGDTDKQITGFIEGLVLPLPLIDTAYLFDAKSAFETASNDALAQDTLSGTGIIRGITVTSGEMDRLTNRPDNIRRPQIPRPYRAQEIQRSFVLPPRIQALKP
ncbi:MAG: hypothetical protein JKY40_04785 [Gammaproteobacteria bacterium]|nr:hypothetical protein [Gammaproteobacteria bacterium]